MATRKRSRGNTTVITGPTLEPITLAEAKAAIKLDGTDDDALVTGLIQSAREWAEHYTELIFMTQTLELTYDSFPASCFNLDISPLQSIDSLKYDDTASPVTDQTLVEDVDYYADVITDGGRIVTISGWPSVSGQPNAVRVRVTAGYAPDSASPIDYRANVPQSIKDAIKLQVIYQFDGDEAYMKAAEQLLWPYRRF